MASLFLPRLSRRLLSIRPGLEVRTSVKLPEQLLSELLDDGIEMIFSNSETISRAPEVVMEEIGEIELAMIVRGGHPLAGKGKLKLAELSRFPVANAVELPAGGLRGKRGAFVCDNFHILRETVIDSDCVWLSSPQFVADDIRAGRLARLDVVDLEPVASKISMIHRRGRTLSPAARIVRAEITELLR